MDNELYSKKFEKFYESLTANFADTSDIQNVVSLAVQGIAEDLKIGMLTADVNIPVSVRVPNGKNERYILYDSGAHSEEYKEFQYLTADGGRLIYQVYSVPDYEYDVEDDKILDFVIGIIAYVSRYVRIAEHDAMTAFTDSLTGCLNSNGVSRNGGLLFLKHDIADYASVYFNIKNFSYFNHVDRTKLGDEILKKFSIAVNAYIQNEEIFARLGGDSFVAFVKKERVDNFVDFITSMNIRANTNRGPKEFTVECNAGLYFAVHKDNISNLINYSAIACKYARNSKTYDCVWFRDYMIDDNLREKEISYKFHDAVSEEKFAVYYQPKVNLEDGTLGGAEALVRWAAKERIIQPNEFIPVLEKEGSIKDLDFYMLKHVCKDIRTWIDKGIEPVPVSINFSKIHIYNNNLAESINKIITEYGVDPKYIEIEITEKSCTDDFLTLKEFMKAMQDRNIKTAIDDFGDGISSLNYLRNLSFNYIKFDKVFIDNVDNGSQKDDIIVTSLIDMLNKLGKCVVAEGVETKKQVDFLKKVGCKYAQGYYFDRPLEKEDFVGRLKNKKYDY